LRYVALALLLCSAVGMSAEPVMLSVKVVKTRPARCSAQPRLEYPSAADTWRVVPKPYHSGDNDWEVYFEIETDTTGAKLDSEVVVIAPGVKAARVIVGKTDVSFRQDGERIRFRLVDDRSRGQEMRVLYRSPRGGYPIHFLHNWKMRRAGKYAEVPYPEAQIAAIPNYLLAAQELLRMMGDMGPGEKKFQGDIVLMGSEIAATRGHLDYPAHVHIMHYQFDEEKEWVSRLVPHLYMDDRGRIAKSSYAVLAGRGQSGELGPGDVCHFQDAAGTPILDLIIAAEGLRLRRPDGETYSLRPDPRKGAAHAVYGFRGDEPVCRVEARDDPEKGVFCYRLDTLKNGKVTGTFTDSYRYDPFTAKVLK
jgi:hypothetical protein